MTPKPAPVEPPCRRRAALGLLCLAASAAAGAVGPGEDARATTYLEYSRGLVAAYPAALAERVRRMERRATTDLSALEQCRRATGKVPGDLEDNPHRRIELVAAGPLGRPPDAWERAALAKMAATGRREHHAFVEMVPPGGAALKSVFRYIGRLDGLPRPCGQLVPDAADGPAVSILRQAGAPRGGSESGAPRAPDPPLDLPGPARQGPRR